MKILGFIFGVLAALGMIVAFIPLLGWLNWVNIPFAILGLIVSAAVRSTGGMILCGVSIFFGLFRLTLGGGII
jgi:hypothetical protein